VIAQDPTANEGQRQQARALGDPTRHRLYRTIEAAPDAITVAALTDEFGLNHNAIRQHLAVLVAAGLVIEELAPPAGPGRRRLRYRVNPAAVAAWGGDNPYEQLAVLLVEVVHSGRTPREDGTVDTLVDLVARQGFAPRLAGDPGRPEMILDRCPFAAAASTDAATVCELHRGLAEGMVDALHLDLTVTGLVAKNPKRAGCRLRLDADHGGPPDT
jgi:predicted ArsR family transcriptional regulator